MNKGHDAKTRISLDNDNSEWPRLAQLAEPYAEVSKLWVRFQFDFRKGVEARVEISEESRPKPLLAVLIPLEGFRDLDEGCGFKLDRLHQRTSVARSAANASFAGIPFDVPFRIFSTRRLISACHSGVNEP
jgi:hypothetical protein